MTHTLGSHKFFTPEVPLLKTSDISQLPPADFPSPFGPWALTTTLTPDEILNRVSTLIPRTGTVPGVDPPTGLYQDIRYQLTSPGFRLRWRHRSHPYEVFHKGFTDPRINVVLTPLKGETEVSFNLEQGLSGWHLIVLLFPLFVVLSLLVLTAPATVWAIAVLAVPAALWPYFATKVWPFRPRASWPSVQLLMRALWDLTDHSDHYSLEKGRVQIEPQIPEPMDQ